MMMEFNDDIQTTRDQEQDEMQHIGRLEDNNKSISEKSYVIVDDSVADQENTIVEDNNKIPPSTEEIEYVYLEFDTLLPTPAGLSQPGPTTTPPPPPCPNLNKYASPFLWSPVRKTVTTMICCAVTMMASYAAGEYTPPSQELMEKWHVSRVVYNLGITLYTLGFGIAPMVLAPFSEFNGRRPIFLLSGVLFTGE